MLSAFSQISMFDGGDDVRRLVLDHLLSIHDVFGHQLLMLKLLLVSGDLVDYLLKNINLFQLSILIHFSYINII